MRDSNHFKGLFARLDIPTGMRAWIQTSNPQAWGIFKLGSMVCNWVFSECCRGHEGSLALSPSQCAGLDALPGSNLRESWSPCCTYQCLWRKTMMFLWLSSQWFQQFLILMQKVLSLFFLFVICPEVYRCWQVASYIFFFITQQKPCFNARCELKREVFCSLGPGVHWVAKCQLWFACRYLLCVFLDDFVVFVFIFMPFFFFNKVFVRQWILVNIYFFFFFFLFSLPFFYSNPWLCTE